jgi:alanine or glycine:cation symporter, AGCS family
MYQKLLIILAGIILPLITFGQEGSQKGLDERINDFFTPISNVVTSIIFYPIKITETVSVPIVVIILVGGATYFTIYFRFVNIRRILMSFKIVKGTYADVEKLEPVTDEETDVRVEEGDVMRTIRDESVTDGEVSHFQALSAALSATVGLGNIAGVAIAIVLGGPGATFWMIIAGLLGMSSKFVECTLGVKYREVAADGTIHGGPMYYLSKGLADKGWPTMGKIFAGFFALMCIGGSIGGGNMFQANQAASQFSSQFGLEVGYSGFLIGLVMAIFVGVVIIGGIKRIGSVAEKIVPFMAVIYVGASLVIIFGNITFLPEAIGLIINGAFSPEAAFGGFIGVLITGFQRAAFSNEAGVGSAAIAHSAVKTSYAASEGLVALLEPFIDTVLICTMTALVIIITGNYANPNNLNGVELTSSAFDTVIPGFSYVLTIAIVLFAFSTMLSWSYYGLQSWKFLFGKGKKMDTAYKIMFLAFTVIGASASLGSVIDFSDAMIFAMVFPNIIGLLILSPIVKTEVNRYLKAIKTVKNNQLKNKAQDN